MSWRLPCGPVFHLLCGWSGARIGMCFLGLMAWAQRPSGAVSGMWRGVSECRRCQSEWAPHTSWKNSEQLGPECSLLSAGLGRANHLCLSGSASLAGQLSRRREQMWLVRVWLGRPQVLWMSQSPGSRASASGFLGLGRRFEEGAGGRCEGAGRWGSAAGAGSGRLWLEMLQAMAFKLSRHSGL